MESRFRSSFFLSFYSLLSVSSAVDTITSGQSLTFGKTLISKNGVFELGFFNPGNSFNYYIGIWYKKVSVENKTYVWVANRDTPLADSTDPTSSELKLLNDGNLVLLNNLNSVIWSTNSTGNRGINSSEAVLGDNGNLVLRNKSKHSDIFWQSFDYPTDTYLPGGRMRYDYRINKSSSLTSWKNPSDPSKGIFSLEMDPSGDEFFIMKNKTEKYWTSGRWNGKSFSRVAKMGLHFNLSYGRNVNESYFSFNDNTSELSRLVMDISGNVKLWEWNASFEVWRLYWSQPRQQCDVHSYCGAYGVCNQNNTLPFCGCVDGFEPRSELDWNKSDFSGGCVGKTALHCRRNNRFMLMSHVRLHDGQLIYKNIRSANKCKKYCLEECFCTAYSYNNNHCSMSNQDLLNIEQLSDGDDLYVRLASPSSTFSKKAAKIGIILGVAGAVLVVGLLVGYMVWKKRKTTKGKATMNVEIEKEDQELPLSELETTATATNNFSLSNKIGQGGFGPVYKSKEEEG